MKKIIAILMVVSLSATVIFAQVKSSSGGAEEFAFVGIEGVLLTEEQEEKIEGEGFLFGAIAGGGFKCCSRCCLPKNNNRQG